MVHERSGREISEQLTTFSMMNILLSYFRSHLYLDRWRLMTLRLDFFKKEKRDEQRKLLAFTSS